MSDFQSPVYPSISSYMARRFFAPPATRNKLTGPLLQETHIAEIKKALKYDGDIREISEIYSQNQSDLRILMRKWSTPTIPDSLWCVVEPTYFSQNHSIISLFPSEILALYDSKFLRTYLQQAAMFGDVFKASELLYCGARVNLEDSDGFTALFICLLELAKLRNSQIILERTAYKGLPVGAWALSEIPPLPPISIRRKCLSLLARILIEQGANINVELGRLSIL